MLNNIHSFTRQTGLSLVELMISMTIGLFLLLGISALIVQQNSTRSELEKSSRQIENGRYAVQLLHDDIQLAGFYSDYSPATSIALTTPDPCDITNLGWNSATPTAPVAIFGYAGTTGDPTAGGCLENYLDDTAVLAIRRTSTIEPAIAATAPASGVTYLQVSNCDFDSAPFVLGTGTGTSEFPLQQQGCTAASGTPATLRPYIVRIYYISSCSECAPADGIPTLKMAEFANDDQINIVPLVEGIENLQFDYGIDNDQNGSPDSYTTADLVASWGNVMAVRVHILARNNDETTGYSDDDKTYNLGAVSGVSPGGAYKRHVYSQLVRAINISGRRE